MEQTQTNPSLFQQPFRWVLLAVGLCFVPFAGYVWRADLRWDEIHPALNAMFNGSCMVFLCIGLYAIKQGLEEFHKKCMLGAFASSALFLVSYLTRFALSGTHRYPGEGIGKIIYLVILFSHMLLAAAVVPLVLRSLYYGLKGQDIPEMRRKHRRVARWTWPIWGYVSVTGVLVYLMLYQGL